MYHLLVEYGTVWVAIHRLQFTGYNSPVAIRRLQFVSDLREPWIPVAQMGEQVAQMGEQGNEFR